MKIIPALQDLFLCADVRSRYDYKLRLYNRNYLVRSMDNWINIVKWLIVHFELSKYFYSTNNCRIDRKCNPFTIRYISARICPFFPMSCQICSFSSSKKSLTQADIVTRNFDSKKRKSENPIFPCVAENCVRADHLPIYPHRSRREAGSNRGRWGCLVGWGKRRVFWTCSVRKTWDVVYWQNFFDTVGSWLLSMLRSIN